MGTRPAWSTKLVSGQYRLHREARSQTAATTEYNEQVYSECLAFYSTLGLSCLLRQGAFVCVWWGGMEQGHLVAHAEVTLLRCFGNESHFEGRIMASQAFHRYNSDFSKRQVFPQLCKTGASLVVYLWVCLYESVSCTLTV